jgi:alpha-L-arabinofuranosidase
MAVTRDLAPDVVRWGGLYSRYYKWREGIGPALSRPSMYNYVCDGWETHRVGTHEFAGFCRRAGAEPLCCVNFSGDGVERYRRDNRWAMHSKPPTGFPTA